MDRKQEWKALVAIVAALFYLPGAAFRRRGARISLPGEVALLRRPSEFLSRNSVMRYLDVKANKIIGGGKTANHVALVVIVLTITDVIYGALVA
jgi:hypothetical protein